MCNKQSGLLGISGSSNDMRTLAEQAIDGDERAQLAIDMFCYWIKKFIGLYSVVLKKVDAVIFTGGIGENAALAREQICDGLGQIGAHLDTWLNEKTVGGVEGRISMLESRVKLLVVPTNEEAAIAADTFAIVTAGRAEQAADVSVNGS
jgi:acetate kinase